MKQKYNFLVFTAFSVAAFATAYVAIYTENDVLAIESSKISMTQAVTTAEQYVGGKASRPEYEKQKGQWVLDVEVVKGKQFMDVSVDPISGKNTFCC